MTIFFKWILYPREFYVCKTFLVPRKVVEKSIKSSPIWILWAERVLADGASRRNSTAHIQWAVYQEEKIILLLLSTAGDSSWQKNYVTCRTKQKDANISFLAIAFNSTYLVLRALLCLLSWAFDERRRNGEGPVSDNMDGQPSFLVTCCSQFHKWLILTYSTFKPLPNIRCDYCNSSV